MKCQKCEKEFATKNALNAHQRVHSNKPRSGLDIIKIKERNFRKGLISYESYLKKPKFCLECNKPIMPKITNSENISDALAKIRPKKFCDSICAAKHNNKNKTYGYRRSKLEIWLEKRLPSTYPKIKFLFNNRDVVGLELDIYIPILNLAFELNGIFHYEPIYGNEKLKDIKYRDNQKYQACISKNISLCVIDTTNLKYFKEINAQKYLDIIVTIINERLQFLAPPQEIQGNSLA